MLLAASRELELDLQQSWMIGDMVSDLLAGKNAGCMGNILVRTGHGPQQGDVGSLASLVVDDLLEAARQIVVRTRLTDTPEPANLKPSFFGVT